MKRTMALLAGVLASGVCMTAAAGEVTGVRAEYFNSYSGSPTNYTFTGTAAALDRIESTINVNGITSAPAEGTSNIYYKVRYTGYVLIPTTGTYAFTVQAADGVRLYLDCDLSGSFSAAEKLIESWTSRSSATTIAASCPNQLSAGSRYAYTYEYYQQSGTATARLLWAGPSPVGSTATVIPRSDGAMGLTTGVSDSTAPTLSSARLLCGSSTQVLARFSEQVDSGSAQTTSNYAISGHTVSAATLQLDGKSVLLTVSPALSQSETLTVSNIEDMATGPSNAIATTSTTISYSASYSSGLTGTYYDQNATAGAFFTGNTVTRTDSTLFFSWNSSPVSGIPSSNYSVRWTGAILVPTTGAYTFSVTDKSNVRLWINGAYYAGDWYDYEISSSTAGSAITLTGGTYVPITLELWHGTGSTSIALLWKQPGSSSSVNIPATQLYHCTNTPGFTVTSSSSGTICGSTSVAVTALNSDGSRRTSYTGSATLSTSSGKGNWSAGSSPAPSGTLDNGTANDGSASYTFVAGDAGTVQLKLADVPASTFSITAADASGSGTSSTISVSGSNAFSFTEDAAGKIAGSNVAVAGRPHDYTVTVTRSDSSSSNCSTATDYTGSHSLKMWRTDSNGSWTAPTVVSPALTIPAAQPATSNITLNFSNGVASLNVGTTDIGRYSFSLQDDSQSYTSATISGTGNALTVRPFALVVKPPACTYSSNGMNLTAINAGSTTGTLFCRAGSNFSATVGAYRWSSAMTSNATDADDDGVPDGTATLANVTAGGLAASFNSTVTLKTLDGSHVPSSGVLGTLNNGSVSGFSGGQATPANLQYTEVGLFQLDSQSLVTDFLGSGLALNGSLFTVYGTSTSTSTIGRFAPARFSASSPSVTLRPQSGCSSPSSFNYLGEPFTIKFTLTAQNALGSTTKNYTGSYAKLDLSIASNVGLAGISGSTAFSTTSASPRLTISSSGTWFNGVSDNIALTATAERASTPDGPFDAIFGIAPVDSDGTAMGSYDLDADSSVDGNDHTTLATVPLRFGRLRLHNLIMARGRPAYVPMVAQYWNGSAFATNTLDSCTEIPANALSFGNYRLTMTASDIIVRSGTEQLQLSGGIGSIVLQQSGTGHRGTFDIAVSLGSSATDNSCLQPWAPASGDTATAGTGFAYLRGAWCGSSHDRDPSARVSYGLYPGAAKFLFQRENY